MKFSLLPLALLPGALAFPAICPEGLKELKRRGVSEAAIPRLLHKRAEEAKLGKRATFSAAAQKVDVTGPHKFVPPNFAAGDQRGPCPGLNALANHNYLPHSGVADMATIIEATNKVYGMSLDLGGFLAVYGTVFDGNPLSLNPGYSIGGPSTASQNILGGLGLLGQPNGLTGSHNKYESDASPTRGDLYLTGNNFAVQLPQFQQYYSALKAVQGKSSDEQYQGLLQFRIDRFQHSVKNNAYFFYSPFSGVLVSPAGFSFPKAMMANHSAEYPDGTLSLNVFSSFFGVSGQEGKFIYKEGNERIPDNWYRRPIGDDYSIPSFLVDVLDHGAQYPPFLDVAANVNGPNTLAPVDLSDLTGGVFRTGGLLEGNNLECFVLQSIMAAQPDILGSFFLDVKSATRPLTNNIQTQLAGLACPQLNKYDTTLFQKYPGYQRSGGAV
ncbi:Cloroperoxidase [Tothia fuscella]|uniref:Cloroperoxidase n=1 Tax=Tothia fuscella TaxID=1048955 RepID=A0A9P4U1J8_9PEZI|nr:Cloroperoxidase [Tothia fuscella]